MPRLTKIFAVKAALSQIGQGVGDLWRAATNYVAAPDVIRARELTSLQRLEKRIQADTKRLGELRSGLGEKVSFGHVDPHNLQPEILAQLVKNERVHPAKEEELLAKRLGGVKANKRCFARTVKVGKQADISSAIYTARINVALKDGRLPYEDLPGDIDDIKSMEIEEYQPPKEGEVCVVVLYTISSAKTYDWVKGGRELADQVYAHLKEEAEALGYPLYITTLSPARGFSKWLYDNPETLHLINAVDKGTHTDYEASAELLEKIATPEGRDEMRRLALRYLLETKDPVLNFHLGNGATLGGINFNANNPLDWAMPNYFYPPDANMAAANKAVYTKTGARPIAPHLYAELREPDMIDLLPKAYFVSEAQSVAPALPQLSHGPAPQADSKLEPAA